MGMPVAPTFVQNGWRGRSAVPDPTGVNTAFNASDPAEDADWTQDTDVIFRVRIIVEQTDTAATTHADMATEFRLQYNNTTAGSGWLNVGEQGTSTEDVIFANGDFAEGDNTTSLLTGAGTFITGKGCEDAISGTCTFTNTTATFTELEFAIQILGANVTDSDAIDLRVLYSAADESPPATTMTETAIPTITANIVVGPITLTHSKFTVATVFGDDTLQLEFDATKFSEATAYGSNALSHSLPTTKPSFNEVVTTGNKFSHILNSTTLDPFEPLNTHSIGLTFNTSIFEVPPSFGSNSIEWFITSSKPEFAPTFGSHAFEHQLLATKHTEATTFYSHTISESGLILEHSKVTFSSVFGSNALEHTFVTTKETFAPTFGSHNLGLVFTATRQEFLPTFGAHELLFPIELVATLATFPASFGSHALVVLGVDAIVSCGEWLPPQVFDPCDEWRVVLTGPSADNPRVTVVARFE